MCKYCIRIIFSFFPCHSFRLFQRKKEPDCKINNLDGAQNGEASKESHRAPNKAKPAFRGELYASQDLVVGVCVKIDLDQLKWRIFQSHWRDVLAFVVKRFSKVIDKILYKLPLEPLVLFQQPDQLFLVLSVLRCHLCQTFVHELNISVETLVERYTEKELRMSMFYIYIVLVWIPSQEDTQLNNLGFALALKAKSLKQSLPLGRQNSRL